MSNTESEQAAQQAAEALEPEGGLFASLDPVSFGSALTRAALSASRHPLKVLLAQTRFAAGTTGAAYAAAARWFGARVEGPIAPAPQDRRWRDPAWDRNPLYYFLAQSYLLQGRLVHDLIDAAELDPTTNQKARLAADMLIDALSPTNFHGTNPTAVKKALDTGGASVVRGVKNFLDDVYTNNGLPRKVDPHAFRVGKDLAATPGKVVLRNELMELIQYEPRTEKVYETPLLCSPPWINKYYIMDLAPGRSFVEWAVDHGHTVFAISYRNPDESMRDITLDDYLINGPLTALETVESITGAERVNIVGLCLGGSMTAMLLAYLAAKGDDRVRSMTLLNTLIDFSEPGTLGAFTDPPTIRRLEKKMEKRGFLDGKEMATTFDLLRANDLIWNYVASNWLMGEDPPAFDILAWNSDSTRMPAAMHSFYLRSCYLRNELARGEMELAGTPLRLSDLTQDTYIVAAIKDHITPWRSSYITTQLLKSDVRFVLSSSGHIAGIVNPPGPGSKARYWTNDDLPAQAVTWFAAATEHEGTWWNDWVEWIARRGGEQRQPPPMGNRDFPPLGDAPGRYVHER
jgi:poly[(R)-3-hydroxyalkanoate] polymerase subunit PhaC